MELKAQLASILEKWNLLNHPFYQSWSAGDLPVEKLEAYAREYGTFVRVVPEGWQSIGDLETVAEEQEHARLWDAFASCLDTHVSSPELVETEQLLKAARESFASPVTALGGLYAFEAQQPATASSKLNGLRLHYDIPAAGETYFEVHADDHHEAEEILEMMGTLTAAEQEQAIAACETVATALWRGLDGVLAAN